MTYTQDSRSASITAASVSDALFLYRMTGRESLGRLFEYELELLSESNSVNLQSLLGNSITVKLELLNGGYRYFNGIVTKVSQLGMMGRLNYYKAIMHPKLWLLTRRSNCKVMPAQASPPNTVPNIVKSILSDHGYSDITLNLSASYEPREYCVQYRETDFDFISRLMEEEGIYYFFKHTDSSHSMVLCDSISAHQAMTGDATISCFPESVPTGVPEYISEWCLNQEIRTGVFTLNDYDFTAPSTNLVSSATLAAANSQANKEMYDYPGGYSQASDGGNYAEVRIEEQHAEIERVMAAGNVRALSTGYKFTLADFTRTDQNREYLVVATQIMIQVNGYTTFGIADNGTEEFQCQYEVMTSAYNFRPPRITRKPIVQGVQTALVVGNSGDEITTDQYGRVKVQFYWDRLGTKDENSSCWVRVSQIWAGKSWGAMFIPRIGQEVIVDFLEGNPDRPIIIGSVYNADQTVPFALPDNKTQSGIKTRSTQSGKSENFNQIVFEDKKDAEQLLINAEKDYILVIENNDNQTIGKDGCDDGSQTVGIYKNRTVTIDQGDDQLTLKTGKRTVDIKQGADALNVTQGDRTVTLDQGNHLLTVKTGNETIDVKTGNAALKLGAGNYSVKADAGQVTIEAMQGIELKVGSNSVKIDQTGVTIKGTLISISGDAKADLKSPMTTVSGDGMLTVKGGVVMIN